MPLKTPRGKEFWNPATGTFDVSFGLPPLDPDQVLSDFVDKSYAFSAAVKRRRRRPTRYAFTRPVVNPLAMGTQQEKNLMAITLPFWPIYQIGIPKKPTIGERVLNPVRNFFRDRLEMWKFKNSIEYDPE